MSDKDRPNLLAMLDAIAQIQAYTGQVSDADQFFDNRLVFDATLMNFVLLGEMAARISEPVRTRYPQIAWPKIKAFRNLVAHEYLGIDAEEVWQIVHEDIPPLCEGIQRAVNSLPNP